MQWALLGSSFKVRATRLALATFVGVLLIAYLLTPRFANRTRIRQRATLRPTKAWLPLSTAAPAALFNGMPTAAQASTEPLRSQLPSGDPCLSSKIPVVVCKALNLWTLPHSFVLFNASHAKCWSRTFRLLHIDKTGGTTLEHLLAIKHQQHVPLIKRFRYQQFKWITTVRDPIDRIASHYYFWVWGEHQSGYAYRQAKVCKEFTGKAYGKPCVPKVSLYEFTRLRPNETILRNWREVAGTKLGIPDCPQLSIWKHLVRWFWIIGPITRMDELQALIIHGLGLHSELKLGFSANTNKLNRNTGVNHSLSPFEHEELQKENFCDYELVAAADQFLSQLVMDFGEDRMQKELARAANRSHAGHSKSKKLAPLKTIASMEE